MSSIRSVPTLDDVAKSAGVSTATVSRCLNSPGQVVEGTRLRVMRAVEELGYTPNFGARVMAAKRTFTVGAIIPTMENAIFARGLQAFQEELHSRNYTLLVASSAYRPEIEEEQIRALVARGADGLLLIGHDRDPSLREYLRRQNVPALVAWTVSADTRQPSVGFDNRAAMRAMTDEVLKLGHKRVGVISAISTGNDRVRQRIEGIRDAMQANGFDPDTLAITETAYGIENGAEAFDLLMRAEPRPTVLICGNDVLAVGALRRARERGLDVPGDVSITGFDDMELARIVTPALTTVGVPHREMGRIAARELIDMIENDSPGSTVELKTVLKMRESLSVPKP